MEQMNILLVCAGGMSTGILMKKMEKYWSDKGIGLNIKAVGLSEYQDIYQNFDIVMVGPQVSYRLKEIKENTQLPCEAIQSFDYAVANCDNIMKLAEKLYSEK
ncbi:PTS sugar transporter subunit IIB [Enterococcus cecorum]|uniref:PTS sugar transporter subunit IIB n=1 Tax=Enterococcus cecorum TaxID=44008 RepID=UPI00200A94A7|nr:PTS sugar transporter subunit IIB [Enterococcus cecorum]